MTDLAAAHLLALDALREGAASTAYNLGNGRPTSVRDILEVDRAGHRPPGAHTRRALAATATRRCSTASSARIRTELGWAPAFEDVDTIVETAWKWRERHPQGYPSR